MIWLVSIFTMGLVLAACMIWIEDPIYRRSVMIAGICLILWLSELVPLYVPTLVMWIGIALLLSPLDPQRFGLAHVLRLAGQPVLALFFGGLVLSVAFMKYGLDTAIADWMIRLSRGRRPILLLAVMAGTAVLSMWISNIAAAAMMLVTLKPLLDKQNDDPSFRKALLLGIAFAADFGGMATPLGSGPNLVAIGAVAPAHTITFLRWMSFALPLTGLMVGMAYVLLVVMHRVRGSAQFKCSGRSELSPKSWVVITVFLLAVTAWLSEPWHGIEAGVVALAVSAVLFGSGLLDRNDLVKVEWDTLLLIAGGLTLGELLRVSGAAQAAANSIPWAALHPTLLVLAFVLVSGLLSAVASNTAAAAMLVPIGLSFHPEPWFAVLIALGASMGVPFAISTPPNAMAVSQGLRTRDLFLPGVVLMVAGCAFLALTGEWFLSWMGVSSR